MSEENNKVDVAVVREKFDDLEKRVDRLEVNLTAEIRHLSFPSLDAFKAVELRVSNLESDARFKSRALFAAILTNLGTLAAVIFKVAR